MNIRIPLIVGLVVAVAAVIVVARLPDQLTEDTILVPVEASGPRTALSTPSSPAPEPVTQASTGRDVTKLIADTQSADAGTRAAAITALAEAPRAEALPVLGRILTDGEPQVDRPLALRSLRDLALNQGDDDGAVRDAVRHAIYHGDDFTKVDEVQEVLDVIEESLKR
jgi:hypothetical protein